MVKYFTSQHKNCLLTVAYWRNWVYYFSKSTYIFILKVFFPWKVKFYMAKIHFLATSYPIIQDGSIYFQTSLNSFNLPFKKLVVIVSSYSSIAQTLHLPHLYSESLATFVHSLLDNFYLRIRYVIATQLYT